MGEPIMQKLTVGQEVLIDQWDTARGDAILTTDTDHECLLGFERAVVTHIGREMAGDALLCWVEWTDRPLRHHANGSFRPATQLFLEVL